MKKTYVKPAIEFVNFRMSTSIAANCALQATQANENNCSYDMGGFEVFTNCEYQADPVRNFL